MEYGKSWRCGTAADVTTAQKREAEDLCKLSNANFRAMRLAEDDGQCDEVARTIADLDRREALTNRDEQLGVWVTAAPEK
ncbi:hypothetical protein Csa_005706 [Cucumis sativus]|nr:hypothetical protein Csa_005706 [Cucumis sativus]